MRTSLWLLVFALFVSACGAGGAAPSPESTLTIAAAADLKYALDEILAEFARNHPETKVKVSYGSSGSFYSQISNGAPFDVFLSADMDYPRKLIAQGLADRDSEFRYSVGRIVLWVPIDSPIDVAALKADALKHENVQKVAIANPKHAPYGRAAEAALKNLGLYDRVKDKFVLGENIAQAAQFVDSGNADIGILAMSLAVAPAMAKRGKFWEIPLENYPRLEQGGCILAAGKSKAVSSSFRDLMLGEKGREILQRYGFFLPSE